MNPITPQRGADRLADPLAARPRVALASESPRRVAILQQFGFDVEIIPTAFDEATLSRELAPQAYVLAAARGKALGAFHALPVVAADTIVVVEDSIFGKPADVANACSMLRRLSGRTHQVLSAVALCHQGSLSEGADCSHVTFGPLTKQQIADYVAGGEPFGKAGAYAIQGSAGQYIAGFSGSYWNIVGFPIEVFLRLWDTRFGCPES